MKDVTIIVTTFERPAMARNLVKSARKFYPDIDIIVSDNGRWNPKLNRDVVDKYGCGYLKLPFDSGVSNARNEALEMTNTKYAVICDDDYEFTEQTKLENFRTVLEEDKKVGVVAGELIYYGKKRTYIQKLLINERDKFFVIVPILKPEWLDADGVKYCYVDHAYQFFMMRNVPEIRWDKNLICQWEHVDFSIRMKKEGRWLMAATPDVIGKHVNQKNSKHYVRYRTRVNDWARFYKKTGYIDNLGGVLKPASDSKGRENIPFPEYMYFLLEERNKQIRNQNL